VIVKSIWPINRPRALNNRAKKIPPGYGRSRLIEFDRE
jgi:hypothetical protein